MDTLVFIYFILGMLLIIAGIVFGFLWHISNLTESFDYHLDQAKEEREKLIEQFREQLVDQSEIMSKERKDLYDRIMAGTLPQYKEQTDAPNETTDTSEDENLVDLAEAKDDLMGVQDDE